MKNHYNKILNFFLSAFYLLLATCSLLLLSPSLARAATIQRPPSNLGLSAYWSFNEGAGNIAHDFSGNSNAGLLSGTTPPTWVMGKRANALTFDGSNSYITGSGTNLSNLGANANVTISAWIKPSSISGTQTIFSKGASGACFNYGAVLVGGNLKARNSGNDYSISSTTLSTNIWQHITIVFSGSTVTGYINASSTGSAAQGTSNCADTNWSIGRRAYNSVAEYFAGGIDDVRIYNRALSAADIQTLYNAGAVKRIIPNKLGLVGYWPMDEGGGIIAHDFSGNGNNGTLAGTTLPSWINGRHGLGLNFDGSTSKISLLNSSSLSSLTGSFTISHWVKTTSSAGQMYTVANAGGANGYRFGLAGGRIAFLIGDGTADLETTCGAKTFNDGSWHLITGVFSRSGTNQFTCYGDGIFLANVALAQAFSAMQTAAPGIGKPPCCIAYAGTIDDLRIYNRALSDAEVLGLYQSGEVKVNAPQNNKLTTGLIGLWTFNGPDVSGSTVYDRSGQGNNGTTTGAKLVIGKVGQAMKFNGSSDYVAVSATPVSILNITGNQITQSGWIFPLGYSANSTIATRNAGYYFQLHSDGTLASYQYGTSGGYTYSTGTVPLNQWSYVAYTYNGSNITFYINGAASGTFSKTGNITQFTGYDNEPFRIGWDSSAGARYFKGSIDEIRLYNRALSPAEIKQLYLMGK